MSLIRASRPVRLVSAFYLMYPLTVTSSNRFEPTRTSWSFVLRWVLLLAFTLMIRIVDHIYYRRHYHSLGHTMDTLHSLYYFMNLPVCVMSVGQAYATRRHLTSFLNTCYVLDDIFEERVRYRWIKNVLWLCLSFVCVFGISYLCFLINDYETRTWTVFKIGNLLMHLMTQQVILITALQWIFCHLVLRNHIALMNRTVLPLPQSSYFIYNKVARQCLHLNSAFGWQILFIVPLITTMMLYNTYYLSKNGVESLHYSMHIIFELFIGFVVLVSFVFPSCLTSTEAARFVKTLRRREVNICGDDVKTNLLYLQAHHLQVEFSAKGVFKLDTNLLIAVWSTLATYLVILVQNY